MITLADMRRIRNANADTLDEVAAEVIFYGGIIGAFFVHTATAAYNYYKKRGDDAKSADAAIMNTFRELEKVKSGDKDATDKLLNGKGDLPYLMLAIVNMPVNMLTDVLQTRSKIQTKAIDKYIREYQKIEEYYVDTETNPAPIQKIIKHLEAVKRAPICILSVESRAVSGHPFTNLVIYSTADKKIHGFDSMCYGTTTVGAELSIDGWEKSTNPDTKKIVAKYKELYRRVCSEDRPSTKNDK